MTDREKCLDKAKELVMGDRADEYGGPRKNFPRIARLWSVILGIPIAPWEVAECLGAVKTARAVESLDKDDSWFDGAGYWACGYEVRDMPREGVFDEQKWGERIPVTDLLLKVYPHRKLTIKNHGDDTLVLRTKIGIKDVLCDDEPLSHIGGDWEPVKDGTPRHGESRQGD